MTQGIKFVSLQSTKTKEIMFTIIVGFTTPLTTSKGDRTKYIKAMSVAVIVDFLITYTIIKWNI